MNRPWGIRTASFTDPAVHIWEIAHGRHAMLGAMAKIGSVVLNVTDIGRAAAFWRGALGYVPRAGGHLGALVPETGAGPSASA